MHRIDVIERKLKVANDLQSIVKTMKGLAAVSIGQYEHAADSISSYFGTIQSGLQIILGGQPDRGRQLISRLTETGDRKVSIVFGSGQPMCGSFNEVITTYFLDHLGGAGLSETHKLVAVGHRVSMSLARHGLHPGQILEVPSTVDRVNETVHRLVQDLLGWHTEGYRQVHLFHNSPLGTSQYTPRLRQLLPVDRGWLGELAKEGWDGRSIPTYSMDPTTLFSALVNQLFFVSLYKAFAESLSAENNSRLLSMQMAEKRIAEMIDELENNWRSQRQLNITEEILDILAGFEIMRKEQEEQEHP